MSDNDPIRHSGEEPAIFAAVITPHRSLSRAGFITLMTTICGISFTGGLFFLSIGAWPVFGFMGLDVLLIYLAFRANYRAAAAYEQIRVTASELNFRKVSARGQVTEWSFNPVWTRLDREDHEDFGLLRLFLVSRGQRLAVAGELSPPERESFAEALAAALGEARRGPVRTVIV